MSVKPFTPATESAKLGKTNELATLLSESDFDTGTTSLASQLEDVAVYGFSSEVNDNLIQLGYTPEDIATLETKITEYNAYLYRISTDGFTSEEVQSMKGAGYTDGDIENLRNIISQRYSSDYNAAEQLNASKNELYQLQATLSVLALRLLMDESGKKGKISNKQLKHLYELEEKLIGHIDKPEGKKDWKHIRNDGKKLYKYSEMLIKKSDNASEFSVDYFIGLQMHLAAMTALEGDEEFALKEINTYKLALEDLASKRAVEKEGKKPRRGKLKHSSFTGPLADSIEFGAYKVLAAIGSFASEFSIPSVHALTQIIGQVDELREDNNVAEITIEITNPGDPELSSMMPLWVMVGGVTVTSSGPLAEVIAVLLASEVVVPAVILAGLAVGAYVVINWASNPTIEKYKKEIDNGDGTITVIEKHVRLNGDVVFWIKVIDKTIGKTLLVVQLVYSGGILVHEDVKYQDPTYLGSVWDLGINFINLNEWEKI